MQNDKEHYHYKYGQCERCGTNIEKCGPLTIVEYWENEYGNSTSYLWVCDDCYTSRKQWCKNLFPESCDWCKKMMEEGDTYNACDFGEEYKDERSIICYSCYSDKKDA